MVKIGNVNVGGANPVRTMGILNTSPESFYKKSISTTKTHIKNTVKQIEDQGADFVDIGGMSTAPYLTTMVPENVESRRVLDAVKIAQNSTNLPISVDTCRSQVAHDVLEQGVEIINDISGLKYDNNMPKIISRFDPSLILCAYSSKSVVGSPVVSVRRLFKESLKIAKKSDIPLDRIVLDPAIGFFRRTGRGPFFTRINSDWVKRDLSILKNLSSLKGANPILISASNKSFLDKILKREDSPLERVFGSVVAEAIAVINGADIIRTHNVQYTKDAVAVASSLFRRTG